MGGEGDGSGVDGVGACRRGVDYQLSRAFSTTRNLQKLSTALSQVRLWPSGLSAVIISHS